MLQHLISNHKTTQPHNVIPTLFYQLSHQNCERITRHKEIDIDLHPISQLATSNIRLEQAAGIVQRYTNVGITLVF